MNRKNKPKQYAKCDVHFCVNKASKGIIHTRSNAAIYLCTEHFKLLELIGFKKFFWQFEPNLPKSFTEKVNWKPKAA